MKEKPILFKGAMVRAILAGSKTQTRRILKGPWKHKPEPCFCGGEEEEGDADSWGWEVEQDNDFPNGFQAIRNAPCSYGAPGDRLWVRETFYCDHFQYPDAEIADMKELLYYRATDVAPCGECYTGFAGETMDCPWRPSIHMPRWASRLTLEITDVRVQRLQDITEEDAVSEGIEPCEMLPDSHWRVYGKGNGSSTRSEVWSYQTLWESINGPGSWDLNPWVWALEFEPVKAMTNVQCPMTK